MVLGKIVTVESAALGNVYLIVYVLIDLAMRPIRKGLREVECGNQHILAFLRPRIQEVLGSGISKSPGSQQAVLNH